MTPLERVQAELSRYEHLLLAFDAVQDSRGEVELRIWLKVDLAGAHVYSAQVHSRDIEHPQFAWTFQKHLYDCMHDYLCELFTRNPQQLERAR